MPRYFAKSRKPFWITSSGQRSWYKVADNKRNIVEKHVSVLCLLMAWHRQMLGQLQGHSNGRIRMTYIYGLIFISYTLLFFFKYPCINSFHRRSLYTLYVYTHTGTAVSVARQGHIFCELQWKEIAAIFKRFTTLPSIHCFQDHIWWQTLIDYVSEFEWNDFEKCDHTLNKMCAQLSVNHLDDQCIFQK